MSAKAPNKGRHSETIERLRSEISREGFFDRFIVHAGTVRNRLLKSVIKDLERQDQSAAEWDDATVPAFERASVEKNKDKPGTTLIWLLAWVPASSRKEIFGQTIADMREDLDEVPAGDPWRYRWVRLCGFFSVFMALVRWGVPALLGAVKLAKSISELWKLIR